MTTSMCLSTEDGVKRDGKKTLKKKKSKSSKKQLFREDGEAQSAHAKGSLPSISGHHSAAPPALRPPKEKPKDGMPSRRFRLEFQRSRGEEANAFLSSFEGDSPAETKRRRGNDGDGERRDGGTKDGGLPILPLSVFYGENRGKRVLSGLQGVPTSAIVRPPVSRAFHRFDVNDQSRKRSFRVERSWMESDISLL